MSCRVKVEHMRRAGWCLSGVRRWCRANEIDFARLVREGVPVEEVEHRQDALIQRAVRLAKESEDGQG